MWMELVAAGEFGQILIGVECLCPLVLIETRDTQPCVSVLACLPAAGFLCCFLWAPGFKISVKFRRNFGIFFVFGSYREVEFR